MLPFHYSLRNLRIRFPRLLLLLAGSALIAAGLGLLLNAMAPAPGGVGLRRNALVIAANAGSERESALDPTQVQGLGAVLDGLAAVTADGRPVFGPEMLIAVHLPRLDEPRQTLKVDVRGVANSGEQLHPYLKLTAGRWANSAQNEVMVGIGLTGVAAGCALGEQVVFAGRNWAVVGIVSAGGGFPDAQLYADALQLREAFRQENYHSVNVRLRTESDLPLLQDALAEKSDLGLRAIRLSDSGPSAAGSNTVRILGLAWLAIAGLLGFLFHSSTTLAAESRKVESATLLALGFSNGVPTATLLREVLLIAAGGAVPALAIAFFLRGTTAAQAGISLGVVLLLSLVAALRPAQKLGAIDIAETLHTRLKDPRPTADAAEPVGVAAAASTAVAATAEPEAPLTVVRRESLVNIASPVSMPLPEVAEPEPKSPLASDDDAASMLAEIFSAADAYPVSEPSSAAGMPSEDLAEYLRYYGFRRKPFSNTPDERFYFASPQHSQALMRVMSVVENMEGLAVVTGNMGRGKSTLARRLLASLDPHQYEATLMVIIHSSVTADWLLTSICRQFGVEDTSGDKLGLIGRLYQRLVEFYKQRKKAVLIIDEAQMLMSREVMEELRGLLNLEIPGRKLLSIVLFGMENLDQALALDEPLRHRISVRYALRAMDVETVDSYILHRTRVAGVSQRLFELDAIGRIAEFAGGSPRLINTVCNNCLLEGYFQRRQKLDAELVESVGSSLKLDESGA